MHILVISDTHTSSGKVPQTMDLLRPHLEGVDAVVHAGDITSLDLVEALSAFAPVHAVAGNMDGAEVRTRFPDQAVLELSGKRVGLVHGWGAPDGLAERVCDKFRVNGQPALDVIVFGHSHRPLVSQRDGILLINPGSPTDRMFAPYRSLALLEIAADVQTRIVNL